jgi:transposase-like protein
MERPPGTLQEAFTVYADAEFAFAEAAESRWPNGVTCVRCGAENPMFLKTRGIWKCSECRKQFSLKAGTLLEDSAITLSKWLPALWTIANHPNPISSYELGSRVGVSRKTAWLMLHRIHLAVQANPAGGIPDGFSEESDQTVGASVLDPGGSA